MRRPGAADHVADEEDRGRTGHRAQTLSTRGAYSDEMAALPDPDTPPPARAEPVAASRAGSSWSLLPLALARRRGRCCAPPGAVVLLFIIAGLIALLLNPFVSLLRRARVPRGLAVLLVLPRA